MLKPERLYPRDIIALFTLLACFILMYLGVDSFVSFIIIMVITFYFARRFDGEGEPTKDINEKVKKLEEKVNGPKVMMGKFGEVKKTVPEIKEPLTTGDFRAPNSLS